MLGVVKQPWTLGNTYPTPATRDGTERVRTYPVTPPTMHRVPMTNAGIADCKRAVKYVGKGRKDVLAPEQTPNHGDPNAPFSEISRVYEVVGRCERTCEGDGSGRVTSQLARVRRAAGVAVAENGTNSARNPRTHTAPDLKMTTTTSDTLPERNEEYATREYWYAPDGSHLFLIALILFCIRDQRYAQ